MTLRLSYVRNHVFSTVTRERGLQVLVVLTVVALARSEEAAKKDGKVVEKRSQDKSDLSTAATGRCEYISIKGKKMYIFIPPKHSDITGRNETFF